MFGGAVVDELHAQTKPPVYAINEIELSDPATYAKYQAINIPLVHKLGGRYLVRGGTVTPAEGAPPQRVVVIAFDSLEKMYEWKGSPEYAQAKVFRDQSSKHRSYYVSGFEDDGSK